MSETNQNELEVGEKVNTNMFKKIVNIIVSPQEALKAIEAKPNVILPIIIVMLVPFLYNYLLWDQLKGPIIVALENQYAAMGLDMSAQGMDMAINSVKLISYFQGVFAVLLGLISGLYYFICSRIAGSDVSYKKVISLVYHVMVIGTLIYLVNTVLVLLGVDVSSNAVTSLASLLPASMAGGTLFAFLSTIEVFKIWGMIVTGFGLMVVAGMSKKASVISVLLAYGVTVAFVVGSMLIATLSGAI